MLSDSSAQGADSFPDVQAVWEEGFSGRDGAAGLSTRYSLTQDGSRVTLRSVTTHASAGTRGDESVVHGTIVGWSAARGLARIHLEDHRIAFFDLARRRLTGPERNLRMSIRFTRPEGWPPGDLAPIGALLSELFRIASDGEVVHLTPTLDEDGHIHSEDQRGVTLRGEYRREVRDRPVHLHVVLDGPSLPFRIDLGLTRTHHPHRLLLDGTLNAVMLRDHADAMAAATARVLEDLGLGPVEIRVWKR